MISYNLRNMNKDLRALLQQNNFFKGENQSGHYEKLSSHSVHYRHFVCLNAEIYVHNLKWHFTITQTQHFKKKIKNNVDMQNFLLDTKRFDKA